MKTNYISYRNSSAIVRIFLEEAFAQLNGANGPQFLLRLLKEKDVMLSKQAIHQQPGSIAAKEPIDDLEQISDLH
jgi:hypothetical protein